MNEDMNNSNAFEGRYVEDTGAAADGKAARGKLPWGFYVLVAGGLWAVAELLQSILYFFN